MVRADFARQLMISIHNSVGSLAEVTNAISAYGINFVAICAYAVGDQVAVMFVTEDNNESKRLLQEKGFIVSEEEVILLSVDNKPGALQMVTNRLAEAEIDLKLIYGSVEKESEVSRIVLIADDNLEAMMIIKTLIERR